MSMDLNLGGLAPRYVPLTSPTTAAGLGSRNPIPSIYVVMVTSVYVAWREVSPYRK